MLEHWIYQGTVEDPYHEFMIEERKEFTKETLSEDFENAYLASRPPFASLSVALLHSASLAHVFLLLNSLTLSLSLSWGICFSDFLSVPPRGVS